MRPIPPVLPFPRPLRFLVAATFAVAVPALVLLALQLPTAAGAGTGARSHAVATTAAQAPRVRWIDHTWFLDGVNLPTLHGCDFGCGPFGGVRLHQAELARTFARLDASGTRVVRWQLLASDLHQVRPAGNGLAGSLDPAVAADLDVAVHAAHTHDLYLWLVVVPDIGALPPGWTSTAAGREALATALEPLFRRYRGDTHLLAWELASEPERAIDAGTVTADDAHATVARLAAGVHAQGAPALATVGPVGVDRIAPWGGLGLDFYAPHASSSAVAGPACALCTTAAGLAADRPVVLGALGEPAGGEAAVLRGAYDAGYAGAIGWSLDGATPFPGDPTGARTVRLAAHGDLAWAHADVGPRSGPRNPCLGPAARTLACPDLRMSPPRGLFLKRTKHGRALLLSTNSINNLGRGPAQLDGRRDGPRTMHAVQVIHRRGGRGTLRVDTHATLLFKAVPGQDHYWKWKNAATMELWRLDGAGRPVELVRRGPKTVYCLRDLKHTAPGTAHSPHDRVFPTCSQDHGERRRTLGTSVGWSDVYPFTYNENWIDVTGLRGCYAYVHVADPDNVILESDESNNSASVVVRLPFRGSNAGCPGARPLDTGSGSGNYRP